VHYVKSKREKISICNLCRGCKPMTWDHVPPQGGINVSRVEMETMLSAMAGNRTRPMLRESQNGVKYRTICKECNEYLGLFYDPTLNGFAKDVARYLTTRLQFPPVVSHRVQPQRLLKSVLGHLVAAKIDIEDTEFDKQARLYVLDKNAPLPADINMFYWIYPYDLSITIRDFAMFTPRGTYNQPTVFQTLKYFPIAYLCCDKQQYAQLPDLSQFRNYALDDEAEIQIPLARIEDPYWPEAPSENNVLFGGQSAAQAVFARPR
jgi:hypothetical protein